ncbi:fibronectin type III domain-containing protein [Methylosarcina fibrata]|uniref:fibronectin type III domain-containing protein n=1 Tax=Methylosarcina fibrata TaxID=105972 RepID=UPI001E4FF800|nr:fibronectin type III domain-containing protein [Methylosarcina fibrata]
MKYSMFHAHLKHQNTGVILHILMCLCLSGILSAFQINSAQAAIRPPRDTRPPTVPSGLTATAASSSQINLSWTASTDSSSGVRGYKVYRGTTQIANVTTTSFSNTGLAANTNYQYSVAAYDRAGNTSSKSTSVSATTLSNSTDTTPPSTPDGLTASAISSSTVNLSWTAATDNVGVKGYTVFRDGSQIASVTTTTFTNNGLSPATSYQYTVLAYDAAGNNSSESQPVSATTLEGGSGDTTAPTVPTNLNATATSSSAINLTWTASEDAVGVTGYKIFRNGSEITTVTGTSFSNTGLTASTTYSYTVSAMDAAGNESDQSQSASATTQSGGGGGPAAGVPAGIYSIDNVVDKPFVDGVLIRIHWSQVEKTEGTYDFSKIATTVKKAQALGHSVTLATIVAADPTWLAAKSETYNDPQFGQTIVPWDTTMLSALEKLTAALSVYQIDGVPLKDHPTVKQVDAPIGGIQSVRLRQLPSGYTADKLKEGVYRSVGAWATAFPNKHLYVGLFGIQDNISNPSTADDIRDTLLAQYKNVSFFQEVLSGSAPNGPLGDVLEPAVGKTGIMFQACGEWSNQGAWPQCNFPQGDTPSAGIAHGYNDYGATYFEIYENDLNNSSYASQFQQWHDTLAPYLP